MVTYILYVLLFFLSNKFRAWRTFFSVDQFRETLTSTARPVKHFSAFGEAGERDYIAPDIVSLAAKNWTDGDSAFVELPG
jgi:hypothetical protein